MDLSACSCLGLLHDWICQPVTFLVVLSDFITEQNLVMAQPWHHIIHSCKQIT
jgi:hypothetical protein